MKTFSYISTVLVLLWFATGTQHAYTQQGTRRNIVDVEFKALGLCGMCKTRIERAALSVGGVRQATWNQEKQMVAVRFDESRTNQEAIERAIARAGHDTQNFITDEVTYKNLHHCCKYPRNPEMLKNNRLHNK
ncbi:MAG TPA: heavy-metal-associated domain-containing protein [Bacteroidales bacterium]|nr:heavy-metal-associated domain-containing protein [Bacteroidales bacterium]